MTPTAWRQWGVFVLRGPSLSISKKTDFYYGEKRKEINFESEDETTNL